MDADVRRRPREAEDPPAGLNPAIETILFVELLGGIGDLLIALPAIQALARSYPQARLTVLTFPPGGELLSNDPLIHRIVYADRSGDDDPEHTRRSVEAFLAANRFDLIVSDTTYDGIDQVVHNAGARRVVTNLWRRPPPDERVGERFLRILMAEGVITPSSIAPARLVLTTVERQRARAALGDIRPPVVVLCPDAGMAIKKWPAAHFVDLGQSLRRSFDATVVVPAGADPAEAEQIAAAIGGGARCWPRGPLRDLAALLACADLVVAADTGLARIAATLGVPTITLFGPSWHGRYGQPPPHVNLQGYPACPERTIADFTRQRCWYGGVCPLGPWHTCLETIAPADVLAAAAPFLRAARPLARRSADDDQTTADRSAHGQAVDARPARDVPSWHVSTVRSSTDDHLQSASAPGRSTLQSGWADARRMLVMRPDNIGDVLMTGPALRAIKANLPQAQVTLLASPAGSQAAPLLPWIDDVLTWRVLWQDLGHLDFDPAREWRLIATLRERRFDAAIIFTSFKQTPHPAGYLCYLAGIPLRLGESKEWGGGVLSTEVVSAPNEMHQVERNLRLIESIGFRVTDRSLAVQIPPSAQARAVALLAARGLAAGAPYLLLNPWASCAARTYAWDRFAVAARRLATITGWPVIVTGLTRDRHRSRPLLDALGPVGIDLVGATDLPTLAALVAGARLVLTNNTSTMHLADATRRPAVVLFSGTEHESQWRPRHSPARLLRRPTPCSPCYAFTCPFDMACLDIPPEDIVAAGLDLLEGAGAAEQIEPSAIGMPPWCGSP